MPRNDELLSTLSFGIEIEMTGQTRKRAAEIIAEHFGRDYGYVGGAYDKYIIKTYDGVWNVMYDSSITPLRKSGDRTVVASDAYKVEVTSPPLIGEQAIDGLQEVVRKLKKAGFFPSDSCGIHIHVDIQNVPVKGLINLCNQIHSKQSLLYKALGISSSTSRYRYCREIPTALVEKLKRYKPDTLEKFAEIWYDTLSSRNGMYQHYDSSRYHILNLTRGIVEDSRYYIGTAEFRCFSSTLHAGKIRAYIQFCLLLVAYCAEAKKSKYRPVEIFEGDSEAYKLRCFFLKLGAIGAKYKTMRLHWLDNFGNQSKAWRRGQRI